MKWVELLKAIGEDPAGKFVEVDDEVARSYVAAGLARDGGEGPEVVQLQRATAAFRSELVKVTDEFARTFNEATTAIAKRPGVQSGGGSIEHVESELDKRAGWGDVLERMMTVANPNLDDEVRRSAREGLNNFYGFVPGSDNNLWAVPTTVAPQRMQKTFARSLGETNGFSRAMTESQGTSAGYLTQVTYETMILEFAAPEQTFVNRATQVPMGTRQVEWPALDQYQAPAAGTAAWYGGVAAYRKGESAQRTASEPATKKVILMAMDLTAYTEFSRDAQADATPALDAMIPRLMGGAIGWREDWEAMNGTGVGQFLGVKNSLALLSVARTTTSVIKYQDVFGMYQRMITGELPYAAWYAHPFTASTLYSMVDPGNRFVFMPYPTQGNEGSITGKPSGTLMGLPIYFTEKAPVLGVANDLTLLSMRRYLKGTRSGLEIGLSEHFKFDTDQIAVRAKVRNDGKPQQLATIYLSDGVGTNKVSAFVGLAA